MAEDHLTLIREQFTRTAEVYARLIQTTQEGMLHGLVKLSGVGPNDRVLEVGCGPGLLAMAFAQRCAQAVGFDAEMQAKLAVEKRSQVAFDIEPDGDVCKLTVVHEFFDPDTTISTLVSNGWPRVLAELKTLIETGDVLTRSDR